MTVDLVTSQSTARAELGRTLVDEFRARTPKSAAAFELAKRAMPGGDTRTVAFHAPYPLTIDRGEGYRLIDIDGNEYIDALNNYTSLIHGHAHTAINEAVTAQLAKGTNYAAALEPQRRLAEILVERVDSVDLVRFTNSGTEATMMALRAARAFTGRDLVVKMEGGYHGTYDDFEVSVHPDPANAGSDDAPLATIDTRGVPANTIDAVVPIPFNDIEAAERIFAERGEEIAAVIVEPVLGSGGMIPAEKAFLEALRGLTIASGSLLIFDEVMTFRLGYGGIQEHYGVRPDLTTFAKIMAGGFPGGAFGGRADIMEQFDPARPTPLWQSGTFNGNAITMVAGEAALRHFDAGEVARINRLGDHLRSGIGAVLAESSLPGVATGYGSFVGIHFTETAPRNYREAARADQTLKKLVHLGFLAEGVFCAPRLMLCISTPMDDEVVNGIVGAFSRVVDRIS
jgi:glutamate-1-semialdehyde 2,1-aminomutase